MAGEKVRQFSYISTGEPFENWYREGDVVPLAVRLGRQGEVLDNCQPNASAMRMIFAFLAYGDPKAILTYPVDGQQEALETVGRQAAKELWGRDEIPLQVRTLTVKVGSEDNPRNALVVTIGTDRLPKSNVKAVARRIGSIEPPFTGKEMDRTAINPPSFSTLEILDEKPGFVSPLPPLTSLRKFNGVYYLRDSSDLGRPVELYLGGGQSIVMTQAQFEQLHEYYFAALDDEPQFRTVVDVSPAA